MAQLDRVVRGCGARPVGPGESTKSGPRHSPNTGANAGFQDKPSLKSRVGWSGRVTTSSRDDVFSLSGTPPGDHLVIALGPQPTVGEITVADVLVGVQLDADRLAVGQSHARRHPQLELERRWRLVEVGIDGEKPQADPRANDGGDARHDQPHASERRAERRSALPDAQRAQIARIMQTRPPIGPTNRPANMARSPSKSLMPERPAIHAASAAVTNHPAAAPAIPATTAPR